MQLEPLCVRSHQPRSMSDRGYFVSMTCEYNLRGQVSEIDVTAPTGSVLDRTYSYDVTSGRRATCQAARSSSTCTTPLATARAS
jgi:hypothetical protein